MICSSGLELQFHHIFGVHLQLVTVVVGWVVVQVTYQSLFVVLLDLKVEHFSTTGMLFLLQVKGVVLQLVKVSEVLIFLKLMFIMNSHGHQNGLFLHMKCHSYFLTYFRILSGKTNGKLRD